MNAASTLDPVPIIAEETGQSPRAVAAVVRLLGENATVPFIARYRKEATGGLDEVAIRKIQERAAYLADLHEMLPAVTEVIQIAKGAALLFNQIPKTISAAF